MSRKLLYVPKSVWKRIFLYKRLPVFHAEHKFMYERSSVLPLAFVKSKIFIHNGKKWVTKFGHEWQVGFKFGEFTWNRRIAVYKAKQMRKKKLKLAKQKKKQQG